MKKLLSTAVIGFALLAIPTVSFAQPYRSQNHGPVHVQKHVTTKQVFVKKQRWARGHALPSQYRRGYVSDYHRYHLRAPGAGQRWVRVDNQFILINSITGVIAALSAAR